MIPALVALAIPATAMWLILEASGLGQIVPSRAAVGGSIQYNEKEENIESNSSRKANR